MKAKKVYWCDELGEDILFGEYEVIKPGKVVKLIMTNNALTKMLCTRYAMLAKPFTTVRLLSSTTCILRQLSSKLS